MSNILKINIIVIVAGMFLFSVFDQALALWGDKSGGLAMVLLYCLQIAVQAGINFILFVVALLQKNKDFKFYLLSIFIVLLIGVPLCIGGATLFSR